MTLRDVARLFRTSWILIAVFTLLGAAGAAAVSLTTTPTYTSTTKLFVSVQPTAVATPGDLVQANNFAIQKVASYVAVVPSERVLSQTIDDLGLQMTPQELAQNVSASSDLNTVILDIKVTDPNAQEAATIATGVSDAFSDIVINELESPASGGPGPVKVEVLQPASLPAVPSQPQTLVNVALGAFAGFVLGLVIAIILLLRDTRVHRLADAAEIANAPILGGVGSGRSKGIAMMEAPRSHQAESYRSIRTALYARSFAPGSASTMLVTSSVAGEGKSQVAANLAVAFAENGSRVLIIDGDLRDPGLAGMTEPGASSGLVDVLSGSVPFESAMRPFDDGLVHVLGSGVTPPNPSELLGSPPMVAMLAELRNRYDVVIIDSSPLLSVTDAAVLAGEVDAVLLVTALGTVTRDDLRASVAILGNVGANLLGLAATKLPRKGPDSYRYARWEIETTDTGGAPPERPRAIGPSTEAL